MVLIQKRVKPRNWLCSCQLNTHAVVGTGKESCSRRGALIFSTHGCHRAKRKPILDSENLFRVLDVRESRSVSNENSPAFPGLTEKYSVEKISTVPQ
jgi:hypothetical protein